MAIARKPGPANSVALVGQIPSPPPIPTEVLDRFRSMEVWQEQYERWWNRFGDLLQRDLDQIATQFDAVDARLKAIEDRLTKAGI